MSDLNNKPILMCYGKTPYTPGSYLERALHKIGVNVDVINKGVDFSKVDCEKYRAVLFVESPSLANIKVKHRSLVHIPVLFWIHHGGNRLANNKQLIRIYQPDLILMSHSLHLTPHFLVPVEFFPFGTDPDIFNSNIPYSERAIDVAFVGSRGLSYKKRESSLRLIEKSFRGKVLSIRKQLYLDKLSILYGNSKIVFNQTHDTIKSFNMRIFEGMGCGALVFSDDSPEQAKLFEDRKHYVLYHSKKDLIQKMHYYLNNIEEAAKIAEAGHKLVIESHTYEHRAHQLLNLIRKLNN